MIIQQRFQRLLAVALLGILFGELQLCSAFAGTDVLPSAAATKSARRSRAFVSMYVPKQPQQQAAKNSHKMIPNPDSIAPSVRPQKRRLSKKTASKPRSTTQLSNSVLASCDTLPSFTTAHGLLSPETVARMEELSDSSEAVSRFIRQYRRHGPMSCLTMLSDPEVLPKLTRAMRDIA